VNSAVRPISIVGVSVCGRDVGFLLLAIDSDSFSVRDRISFCINHKRNYTFFFFLSLREEKELFVPLVSTMCMGNYAVGRKNIVESSVGNGSVCNFSKFYRFRFGSVFELFGFGSVRFGAMKTEN
jgi:hypothetical protein